MTAPMILALDTATTTGWAAGRVGDRPTWGHRSFAGDSNGEVFARFRIWLCQRCYELKPYLITFESPYIPMPRQPRFAAAGAAVARGKGPPPMNAKTLRRLIGFVDYVEGTAAELGIRCAEATSSEIAKFFTGRFVAKRVEKKAAAMEMCRRFGWEVSDDNEADALGLWAMAESILDPATALSRGNGALFQPGQTVRQDRIGRRPPQRDQQPVLL